MGNASSTLLSVSGNLDFTTASSTGIVKFSQINSDTGSINFGDENLYTIGNIGIGTSSPYAKLSVVGEVVGSYFTATSTTMILTISGDLTVGGLSSLSSTTIVTDIDFGVEDLIINANMDDAGLSQTGASKGARFRANLGGDGTKPKYTSFANTLMIQPTSSATLTMTEALYGVTVRPTDASNGVGAGTFTVPIYAGIVAGGMSGSYGHTINVIDLYQIKIEDWDTAYGGAVAGTQTNVTGLWMDKQTTGDTNNYGIVLNGDGIGADITFGLNQDVSIYHELSTDDLVLDAVNGGNIKVAGGGLVVASTSVAATVTAGGNITLGSNTSRSRIRIDRGGGGNLDYIGNGEDGQIIILRAGDDANTMTICDTDNVCDSGDGNIQLDGGVNFDLDDSLDSIMLIYDSVDSAWFEVSRSNNN